MTVEQLAANLQSLKDKNPLVHAITNYVTINDCANILISIGASPAMCESADEAYEFSKISQAIYLNIGSLTKEQEHAMLQAVKGAEGQNIPVILDPVGCAAIPRRVPFIEKLFAFGKITAIKGNLGEIKSLAGMAGQVKGVDSIDDGQGGIEACKKLARSWNTIIAATGATDIITDGRTTYKVSNGSSMLTLVSGTGCMLGALTAAFCGASTTPLNACVSAHLAMGIAGERAANAQDGKLPGTFKVKLMDEIYQLRPEDLSQYAKIEID